MKIRKREKISPILVQPGDTIELIYKRDYVDSKGVIVDSTEEKVLSANIEKSGTFNEAVIFDVEKGEFGDKTKWGIGGAFLETEK